MNTLPDTGARSEFPSGAVRDASVGKGLPSRIPPAALRALARRFEDGEAKYPDKDGTPNWMRGINLSRYFDSAFRHLLAAAEGDTSEDHLGAVLWNAACWIWTENEISAGRLCASLDDLPFARPEPSETEYDLGFLGSDVVATPGPRYQFSTLKVGDQIGVLDPDGVGEPYSYTSTVADIDLRGLIRPFASGVWYRPDQITKLS